MVWQLQQWAVTAVFMKTPMRHQERKLQKTWKQETPQEAARRNI